jgi:hypothetical protein
MKFIYAGFCLASLIATSFLIVAMWETPTTAAIAVAFTLAFGFWSSTQIDD